MAQRTVEAWLIDESTSAASRRFWDDAHEMVSSRLLCVETAAALAQARRLGRLTDPAYRRSLQLLDQIWTRCGRRLTWPGSMSWSSAGPCRWPTGLR